MIIFLLCVIAIGVVSMTCAICPWFRELIKGLFMGLVCGMGVAIIVATIAASIPVVYERFYDDCIGEWSLSKTTDLHECNRIKYEAKATSASQMKGELP